MSRGTTDGGPGSPPASPVGGGAGAPGSRPEVSVVVPLHDEADAVEELLDQIERALEKTGRLYEVVAVDDGSSDATPRLLAARRARDPRVRVVRLSRNYGQTAALTAGFDHARGDVVVSLDGDLQHDPAEIPLFLDRIAEGYDVVSGWRRTRPEAWLTRRVPSRVANALMAWLSGVPIHDFGTTFKAYRRPLLQSLDLYGDFHRFIPALAREAGARIAEVPIQVRPRRSGRSHYGLLRTITVFFDLVRIRFLSAWLARPLQLFGGLGLVLAGLGGGVVSWLILRKLLWGAGLFAGPAARGPLFVLGLVAVLLGAQLFALGLVGEMIVRLYFGLRVRRPYAGEEVP